MSSRLFQHISALTIAVLCSLATYAQGWEEKYQNLGYIVETTRISDRDATIIMPQTPNGRWIVRPAFMGAFPQVDEALLEKGWTFGYYNVTDEYATPSAQKAFSDFYDYARQKYNLSERVVLEGLSRGGWFSLVYAVNNPEKIEKLYIDAPLADLDLFKDREGDMYKRILDQWESEGVKRDEVHDYPRRHFSNIKDIPIIVVYGAADEIVRMEKQFGTYDLSGCREISIIGKTGCGHHPHSLNPCDTIVNFLTKARPLHRATPTPAQSVAFSNTLKSFRHRAASHRSEDCGLSRTTPLPATWHHWCHLGREPCRSECRRMGTCPEDRGPGSYGAVLVAGRTVGRTSGHPRLLGKGYDLLAGAVYSWRPES